jgi:hypothetical protein
MPSFAQLEVVFARLAPADVATIEPFLKPFVRRARRLAARDEKVRGVAVLYPEHGTGRGLAAALRRDLQRYAATGWKFERDRPPVGDAKRQAWHAILSLNEGKVLAVGQIRAILAGLR